MYKRTAVVLMAAAALVTPGWGQAPGASQPDAQRTREELSRLLEHYPPSLRNVLSWDPNLLTSKSYLAPYPDLVNFLSAHPEIASSPAFYAGERRFEPRDQSPSAVREALSGLAVFAGFGMAIGLLVWLIRTVLDYRRWQRLAKVQTDVHTKLIDRFTGNEDLLAYIQSSSGTKFLESSPIALDPGPGNVAAPMGRILWSLQAGLVLAAGGGGLMAVATSSPDVSEAVHAFGIVAMCVGAGFVASSIVSFVISRRLGLIEAPKTIRSGIPHVQ